MNQIAMPHLSIAETSSIYPYEWLADDRPSNETPVRLPMVRHPFPVTPLDESNYLLLGDSYQFHEIAAEGLHCLPVQICPSEQIVIESLPVGVTRFRQEDLVRLAGRHADILSLNGALSGASEDSIIRLTCEFDDAMIRLSLRDSTRTGCPTPIDLLFREIGRIGRFLPVLDRRSRRDGLTKTVELTARFELPSFELDDLKAAARSDRLFPPGIIRSSLRRRVLNIDFPVEVLVSDISLTEKQQYLSELVSLRFRSSRTSFYDGQIFLLNR